MATPFRVIDLLNLGNGLWMLLAPAAWYRDLPAGVPDTGPLNVHFVRDIGSAYATIGVALLVAASRPVWRRGVLLATTLFYVLHALVHVTDLMADRLEASHWLIDLPGVFLPTILRRAMRQWLPAHQEGLP